MWSPARSAAASTSRRAALSPLEPFRDHITIISNTDVRNAEAFEAPEIGGDHFRSSAVFLTQMHPRQTQGSDVRVGTSLDQHYAQKFGQDTAIPSMQLCIENVDQAGGCSYGYSCVYTDSISWAAPDQPLPMVRDPRTVFDMLFGVGATPQDRAERRQRRSQHPRLDRRGHDAPAQHARQRRSRAAERLPRRHPRDRAAASSGSRRRTAPASRASCRARRSAFPTRSKSTSS